MPDSQPLSPPDLVIREIETAIRRDPAQRGLIGTESMFGAVCPQHLSGAAQSLSDSATRVAIVTGFYIPRGTPPAAETDGPLGALVLASVLRRLGIETAVMTDGFCFSALEAAARATQFPAEALIRYPFGPGSADDRTETSRQTAEWRREFWQHGWGQKLSHLIAIERVGPSHTPTSLARQNRPGPPPVASFIAKSPPGEQDCCHNMRGENIDRYSGDLHRLFEEGAQTVPPVATIGIGDGANEIGMGAALWEDLERRLSGTHSGWIPCRIPTQWNIVAGTSNWGGYALAAATALLRNQIDAIARYDAHHEKSVLDAMVANGPAVDGVTRLQESTVDGLPFLTYIQPWIAIRESLGLAP